MHITLSYTKNYIVVNKGKQKGNNKTKRYGFAFIDNIK